LRINFSTLVVMKSLLLFSAILLSLFHLANAQTDTLTVMQYNLLNYNNYTSYCTSSNNNVSNKDAYIKTIIDYVLPDIFAVCEMNQLMTSVDRLLNNALNANGRTNYAKGNRTNLSNSDLINMVYYNTDKLIYHSYTAYPTDIRDINVYTFYYKDPLLSVTHDTAWITCIVMHLKAGSTTSNANERLAEVSILMNQLNALNKQGNYLVMGDFNTYSSNEECYQLLVNHDNPNIRFYDPISKPGNWNNNCSFAPYHTQSTHSSSNGCAASGGIDDRFDHIMTSLDIISGSKNVKYINNSYFALGNDGNHCNDSINQGTNNSVPPAVLNALYGNSDHLPVILKLQIETATGIDEGNLKIPFDFYVLSNANENSGILVSTVNNKYNIDVFNVTGNKIYSTQISANVGYNNISLSNIEKTFSILFFRITDENGNSKVFKALW